MYTPKLKFFISLLFIFLNSCTPANLSKVSNTPQIDNIQTPENEGTSQMTKNTVSDSLKSIKKLENKKVKLLDEVVLLFFLVEAK